MTSLTWSALAFLLSALAWVLGDVLIVGFHKPDRRRYGEFIELMGDDTYAFYTHINERRLRWGALVADYSAPLMLAGLYAHWALLRHSTVGVVAVALLGIGFCLAPLAHASFYPLALASERAYAAYLTGEPDREVLRHARRLRRFLIAAWVPAIAITVMGWLLIVLVILLGHTPLPRWVVLLTPPLQVGPWLLLTRLPYPGKPLLDGALFNIINLVWAIALLFLVARAPLG